MLPVRYFAHGGRDIFQIVIEDRPKTTHAFRGVAAILGSWHVSVFAQFFVHADRLMESVAPSRFLLLCMPVKMLYRLFLPDANFGPGRCLLVLAQGHIRKLHSNMSL